MSKQNQTPHIVIIGAGIGGLTAGALLAQSGYRITVLEAHTYPGGCAGTFYHKGYRFEAGATVAGGFQPHGPHAVIGDMLGITWPVRRHEPAWVVHMPHRQIALTQNNQDVLKNFPNSEKFWQEQSAIAELCWRLSADGLPWPPQDSAEWLQLIRVGLKHFPRDLQLLPYAFTSVYQWLRRHPVGQDPAFIRFLDAQLLISAQTTTSHVNAVYGATALDLARQGVYHIEGGIGNLAQTLADKIRALGGEIYYRRRVQQICIQNRRVTGLMLQQGRRASQMTYLPCDFVIANLTPWSLDNLLGENSPPSLRREVAQREFGWGAFALHLGLDASKLPSNLADHHQIIAQEIGPLGEGESIFISLSPSWDTSRAPSGHRAVTITTHTRVKKWWDLIQRDPSAYQEEKARYTEQIIDTIHKFINGFKNSVAFTLAGTPITYQYYTGRHLGMVGGFPQTSLFRARGPRVGIPNLRLVGDSIFPGQSTAGVSLGAWRVANDVRRHIPLSQMAKTILFDSGVKEITP